MMAKPRTTLLVVIAMMFFAISCTSTRSANDEELADRAQQLGYVAVAVNGFVRFGNPPVDLTGEQLVREATKDIPTS